MSLTGDYQISLFDEMDKHKNVQVDDILTFIARTYKGNKKVNHTVTKQDIEDYKQEHNIVASLLRLAKKLISNEKQEQQILDVLQEAPGEKAYRKDLKSIIPSEQLLTNSLLGLLQEHKIRLVGKGDQVVVSLAHWNAPNKKVASEQKSNRIIAKSLVNLAQQICKKEITSAAQEHSFNSEIKFIIPRLGLEQKDIKTVTDKMKEIMFEQGKRFGATKEKINEYLDTKKSGSLAWGLEDYYTDKDRLQKILKTLNFYINSKAGNNGYHIRQFYTGPILPK